VPPLSVARSRPRSVRRRNSLAPGRSFFVLTSIFVALLLVSGSASAYPFYYWQNRDLNPNTIVDSVRYNYWWYNEVWPDAGDAPMGIFFNRPSGAWYGEVNGQGFLATRVGSGNYGKGHCWNRSSYQVYYINDCMEVS
jgi:hypothetical protein